MTVALIGVQLAIDPDVLSSGEAYQRHIADCAARAVDAAGPAADRFIVVPELAGYLALLALAPAAAHRAKTVSAALASAAVRRPLDVLRGVATARTLGPRHAILAALAPDGERYWRSVFAPLARKLGAYIVAGSHLRLASNGDLTSASFLYSPDGRLVATTDKVNLLAGHEDLAPRALGLTRGEIDKLPISETPFGPVCTLISYDGFRVPHTRTERFVPLPPVIAARGGVTIVANPAANPWRWKAPWIHDHGVTREIQWEAEGLRASLAERGFARYGITAHLVGRVLDLAFDGQSEILERTSGGVIQLARAVSWDDGGHVVATVSC